MPTFSGYPVSQTPGGNTALSSAMNNNATITPPPNDTEYDDNSAINTNAFVAKAQAEKVSLQECVHQITADTTQLLSEPTNEEAVVRLEMDEEEIDVLLEKVKAARKNKVNEKHKVNLKRSIDNMAAQWRKRRRICLDFLISMEEYSDGSISMKKCLAGNGPIDIDSDEAVAMAAVAFAQKKLSTQATNMMTKNTRALASSKKVTLNSSSTRSNNILASENFVAVTLDSQGRVERVLVKDDAMDT